jgi:hypothetical protein
MVVSAQTEFDSLRVIANGSITNSYVAFGATFTHRVRILKVTNNSDGDMFIAFNNTPATAPGSTGTTDNDFVPAGGFVLYDFSANSQGLANPFVIQNGTQTWIRYSSAPTKNSVYLTCIYAENQ